MIFKIITLAAITLFSVEARHAEVKVFRPPTCDIKRPCPDFDIKCIQKEFIKRNWFGDNVGNQPEGPLILNETTTYPLPFFKVTAYIKDTVITGLDKGTVTDFYINEDTDTAVLSCEYFDIMAKSTAIMDIHRPGQENIRFTSSALQEHYSKILTTTIIKGLNGLTDMTTHVDESVINKMSYGNGAENIKDEDVIGVFKQFEEYTDIYLKEGFVPTAKILQEYFVNNVIGKDILPRKDEASSEILSTAYAFAKAGSDEL